MNKEEFIKFCLQYAKSKGFDDYFIPSLLENNPESDNLSVAQYEATCLYNFLNDNNLFNVTNIKKIDTDKILLAEIDSVDIDNLQEKGYEVILYRQGRPAPKWL